MEGKREKRLKVGELFEERRPVECTIPESDLEKASNHSLI